MRLIAMLMCCAALEGAKLRTAILVSADAEWRVVKPLFASAKLEKSPYGEFFFTKVGAERVLFFHGGWGKVAAAGSTQYVIDRFKPARLINIGTCGGVKGTVKRFDIVVPDRTVIYDIREAMGDSSEAIEHYSTRMDPPLRPPTPIAVATLYSADADLTAAALRQLQQRYKPVAADWESGAIAWVAKRNNVPLLILRGVTDLVSPDKGEAEGNLALFEQNAAKIMQSLVNDLPKWLRAT